MTDLFCSGQELPYPDSFCSYHNEFADHFTTIPVYNLYYLVCFARIIHTSKSKENNARTTPLLSEHYLPKVLSSVKINAPKSLESHNFLICDSCRRICTEYTEIPSSLRLDTNH